MTTRKAKDFFKKRLPKLLSPQKTLFLHQYEIIKKKPQYSA